MTIATQALDEFSNFITSRPSLEEIIDYHSSPDLTKQVYELIDKEKAGNLSDEERRTLDNYEAIEHILMSAKAEALRKLQKQVS